MTSLSSDYTGCTVFIYGTGGDHLGSTLVSSYDKKQLRIEVLELPEVLVAGAGCKLLIMSSPAPCEYLGRVVREGAKSLIAMYQGQEKENRKSVRYKINTTALIENLVCDLKAFPLLKPLEIKLINISKSGVRFSAPVYALIDGNRFQMRMKISDSEKVLIAEVIHHTNIGHEITEYGCRFLIGN